MTSESVSPRSRRSILAAAAAGAAASIAAALGRPVVVRAADGDPVIVGEEVSATEATTIRNTTTVSPVFRVHSDLGLAISGTGQGESGGGVQGIGAAKFGVSGQSQIGNGVQGQSGTGTGVHGSSQSGTGVYASSAALEQPAMVARAYGGAAGIVAVSGDAQTVVPTDRLDTAVYAFADGYGQRPPSDAVGVHGRATEGTGVHAEADPGGTALRVTGRAAFSRSGVLTIPSGKSSASRSLTGLTANGLLFAVVRTGDSTTWVRKVTPTTGNFSVYLNKTVSSATTVAWFALG